MGRLKLIILPGVLRPPSDAELLAGVLGREGGLVGRDALDVCAGTGVLALTAAQLEARAVAIDLSRRAVLNTRLNARLNGLAVTALRGDLFAPVRGRRFDVIVSNPPYIPAEPGGSSRGRARAWDAGPDGRDFLDRLCAEAPAHLRPGGRILLVHSSLSRPEETERRLAEHGLEAAVVAEHDGELGEIGRARADYLRSLGVVDETLRERMVVVEGRAAQAAPLQASPA
jgi:release factor glutamine methyltransferase